MATLYRRSSIHWAVIATLAVILPGCATLPGPEVLTPVAIAPGVKTLQVYVATTRERQSPSENVFTANRASALNFAKFVISVPPNHKPGEIEMPTNPSDPQTSFAVVDQAVMSEADFNKAVAPQKADRRKKQKVFVFVHGFNNNFQESLFRLAQLQADAKIDGIPILFSWPSQAQVAAYATDQDAASYFMRGDKLAEQGIDPASLDTYDKRREAALAMSDPGSEMWGWGLTPNQKAVARGLDSINYDSHATKLTNYVDSRPLAKLPGDVLLKRLVVDRTVPERGDQREERPLEHDFLPAQTAARRRR